MAAVLVADTTDLSRKDWLELRKKGLGGSDAASAVGVNKYCSPYSLWLDKTDRLGDSDAGEAAYWGNQLEDKVLQEIAKREGLVNVAKPDQLLQHPVHEWMLANPDGLGEYPEYGTVLLEAKTAGLFAAKDWYGPGGAPAVPDAYMLQVQHYLEVLGLRKAVIGVLITGQKFETRWIDYDPALVESLVALEEDFWINHVVADVAPPVTAHRSDRPALSKLYSEVIVDDVKVMGEEIVALVTERNRWKAVANEAKKELEAIENQLKDGVGHSEVAVDSSHRVLYTWRSYDQRHVDTEALKEDGIYEKYAPKKTHRRLLIPKEKKK